MTALILFTVFLLGAVIASVFIKAARHDEDKSIAKLVTAALVALTILTFFAASFTHTKSNEISINHNFGTYQNTTGPGITFVGPFTQSEKFSTRLQNTDMDNVKVTLKAETVGASGSSADVDMTLRYHIKGTDHAVEMWRKFRNFDTVTKKLVEPEAKTSTVEVFGLYTPGSATAGKNVRVLGSKVKEDLQKALNNYGIQVDSVTLKSVHLDKKVQERLNNVQKAAADAQKRAVDAESRKQTSAIDAQTRLDTAKKDRQTAAEQAAADTLRKAAVSRETLVQECLRLAEKMNQPLNCNYYMTNQYAAAPR